MVSLEDILSFMKQDKQDRIKQREQEREERAKQREQDMIMIKEMIDNGVNAEVITAIEPLCQRQKKLEDDQKSLQDKFDEMLEMLADFKKKDSKDDPCLVDRREEFNDDVIEERTASTEELAAAARRTIGLQCIYPEDVGRQMRLNGARDETEARLFAAKEYLWCEMKVGGEVFDGLEVEKIFPPAKENWNTLYVEFTSETSVSILYNYSRNLRKNQRLVPYIPKQFYSRYRTLESAAYNLRHSDVKYKTRVRMGSTDLVLWKKKPSESFWTPVQLPTTGLSQVDLKEEGFKGRLPLPPDQTTKSINAVQLYHHPNSVLVNNSKVAV